MQFSGRNTNDNRIFLWFMLPYGISINLLMFGSCITNYGKDFFISLFCSILYFWIVQSLFGFSARTVKKRYPDENSLFRRIAILLPLLFLMNVLLVQFLFLFFESFPFMVCRPRSEMMWAVITFVCFAGLVIAIIGEAASGWEKWKNSIIETEQLKYTYQKTKLLGLKGQVNPHFLFNCFNTLSSLIGEDEAAADKFLNEMTRVHRYMLRGDDEQLVSLRDELDFARSYLYLINERFGSAIRVSVPGDREVSDYTTYLPPLTMQVVLENIIYSQVATKQRPLLIEISLAGQFLKISHSTNPRLRGGRNDEEEGLDNLVQKYILLDQDRVQIRETAGMRTILIPLIKNAGALS